MEIKTARVTALPPQAFTWAREMNPAQPLTSGAYELNTSADESALERIERIQLRESDIHHVSQLQLARILQARNRVAQKIPSPRGLYRIQGSFGG
jgi:hypothetical protein